VSPRLPHNWRELLAASICGLIFSAAIVAAATLSAAAYVIAIAALVFAFLLLRSKDPEAWCLFAFWMAVPLPMHAFVLKLDPLHGGGALGIYLVAADLPLLLLLLFWMLRPSNLPAPLRDRRYVLAIVPFLAWSSLSVFYGARPLWAFCEWVRWLKFALILCYAAYGLRRRHVELCVWSIACSIGVQAGLGILQEIFKSNLGLDKFGLFGSGAEQEVRQELVTGSVVFRGSGLTGHPNFLAAFLLLLLPVFALLALAEDAYWKRVAWYGTALVGLGGLLATMSRAAWVAVLIAGAVALMLAAGYGVIHLRRFVIIMIVGCSFAGVLSLAFSDLIISRFRSDWSESWDLRLDLARAATDMALDNVVAGVGLNNYTVVYPQYDPAFADKMIQMDDMITAVHNTALLVWAEVGTVGLAAYLFFYEAVFVAAFKKLRATTVWERALTIGVLCGIIAAMAFDLSEICLWADVALYVIAFLVGLVLGIEPAPAVSAGATRRAAPGGLVHRAAVVQGWA